MTNAEYLVMLIAFDLTMDVTCLSTIGELH
ncbi:hypothetical protein XaFJ1_GM002816 [Xanthomonas albilineans]|nr:hypothetical protein XaFJ1_GM002816 [Xanthomonas albilineans]